jgi:hypothetical protein
VRPEDVIVLSLAWIAAVAVAPNPQGSPPPIEVHTAFRTCRRHGDETHAWTFDGERYRRAARSLTPGDVRAIRQTLLDAPAEIPELLATVGVTPEGVAADRSTIVAAALPDFWTGGHPEDLALAPEQEALLAYDAIAGRAADRLLGRNRDSVASFLFEVTLPGDPAVHVRSTSEVPWMLPWTITAGGRTWTTPDVRVSRAMLRLADPDGPLTSLLDGSSYWPDGFYADSSFWWFQGEPIDSALCEEVCAGLPGYEAASRRFRIETARAGTSPGAEDFEILLRLAPTEAGLIDAVDWSIPTAGADAWCSWDDLVDLYDRALAVVSGQHWIADWKVADERHRVVLATIGASGMTRDASRRQVDRAWRHAGLPGEAELELHLSWEGDGTATLLMGRDAEQALVVHLAPGLCDHRLNGHRIDFHVPGERTYGLIAADGEVHVHRL